MPAKKKPKPKPKANGVRVVEAKRPIALVLIDDNRLLREGLAAMIHGQPGFKVLVASADVNEALTKVRDAKPDVVLLDFGLADHDSLSLTKTVHHEVPRAKVIVMGLLPLQEDVADYVRAGAAGFIMKDASFEDFFSTLIGSPAAAQIEFSVKAGVSFGDVLNKGLLPGNHGDREADRRLLRCPTPAADQRHPGVSKLSSPVARPAPLTSPKEALTSQPGLGHSRSANEA